MLNDRMMISVVALAVDTSYYPVLVCLILDLGNRPSPVESHSTSVFRPLVFCLCKLQLRDRWAHC